MSNRALFEELRTVATEQRNPRSMEIDRMSARQIAEVINTEDHLVPIAVRGALDDIADAIERVAAAFAQGGRLIYVGAGTSGRLGVLDASEIPPTYGAPVDLVQGIIAGGRAAMFESQEGAEDRFEVGEAEASNFGLRPEDIVCGLAASQRTPFVRGFVSRAGALGCTTMFVTCVPKKDMTLAVDVPICVPVGPEVVMGSTRMKSGTAQKLVLNMITTGAMIRSGKVYENMMVDLQMTNAKLVERSIRTVMTVTDVSYEKASTVLTAADGHVKTALVMIMGQTTAEVAREALGRAEGFVREAIALV